MKVTLQLYAILFCTLVCCLAAQVAWSAPKNVIFFIGDGMGFEQTQAAGMYAYGEAGTLSFGAFSHQAEMTTYSSDNSVTDSAAAGTALATGFKVNNGVISMTYPGDGSELYTLLEYFRDRGSSTGLVTTTFITHATPAAFGAHEPRRSSYSRIAADYLNQTRPDVLFGGGANGMSVESATAAGYTVVTDRAGMQALDTEAAIMVSGQFGSTHLPYEYHGLGSLPHLSEMTASALAILDNDPDGLFLMVEGGRIDHAGHANDIKRNVFETIEFSNSVQVAIDWVQAHPDTLILVTADHETGGLMVLQNNGQGNLPDVSWTTTHHTGANVPVYAWGVNAELVSGVMDNTDLFEVATADTYVSATIDIAPGTLNPESKGKWLTCYLELSGEYNIEDINPYTVALSGIDNDLIHPPVYAVGPSGIGDHDNDGIPDLMVKFARSEVRVILATGDEVELTVTGELYDSTPFEGSDTIRVKTQTVRQMARIKSQR